MGAIRDEARVRHPGSAGVGGFRRVVPFEVACSGMPNMEVPREPGRGAAGGGAIVRSGLGAAL